MYYNYAKFDSVEQLQKFLIDLYIQYNFKINIECNDNVELRNICFLVKDRKNQIKWLCAISLWDWKKSKYSYYDDRKYFLEAIELAAKKQFAIDNKLDNKIKRINILDEL